MDNVICGLFSSERNPKYGIQIFDCELAVNKIKKDKKKRSKNISSLIMISIIFHSNKRWPPKKLIEPVKKRAKSKSI